MQVFTFPIFHLTDMLIAEGQLSDWSEESVKCEAAAAWPLRLSEATWAVLT